MEHFRLLHILICYVGRTWITRTLYIHNVCWSFLFVILIMLQLSLRSFLFLETKGDEMWSLYAEKLRLLAERFEEAPRLPMGMSMDFWGGCWILNVCWWTMDHSYNTLQPKAGMNKMKMSLDGLVLWMFLCGYLWISTSIRCFGPEAKRRNVKDCEGMYQLFNFFQNER